MILFLTYILYNLILLILKLMDLSDHIKKESIHDSIRKVIRTIYYDQATSIL